jgi:predicted DNA-binding transcriptional regulator YafY
MKLYNIVNSLILESVNRESILKAIDKKYRVTFRYDDEEDPGGKGQRWAEIYCYGDSKAGNAVLRAYQIGGDTKTVQPGWKLFRVDRMMDFKIVGIENAFTEPRPLFNPNGDKSMIRIHRITKFD